MGAINVGISAHLKDSMPHLFIDGETVYRWGLAVIDGVLSMIYEEVV